MNRNDYRSFIIINLLIFNSISGTCHCNNISSGFEYVNQDTIEYNQILYNGRVWRNQYPMVKDNRFLFSKEFLPGSVTIGGKTFSDVMLKYDIFADEVLIPFYPAGILQLNKQMVDSFSLIFQNTNYQFIRIPDSNLAFPGGYYNILYKGITALYARYIKKIEKLADRDEYEKFYQINRFFIIHNGVVSNITGKNDLSRILNDQKKEVRHFIKVNDLKISDKDPTSLISVLSFVDNLKE